MSLPVVLATPNAPDVERLKSGAPAYGADGVRLLQVLAHLASYRRRRQTVYLVDGDASAAETIGELPPGPISSPTTYHLVVDCSPLCRYLALRLDYQASGDSTTPPSISVIPYTTGGAQIEPGIEWDYASGALAVDTHVAGVAGIAFMTEHDLLTVHAEARFPSAADLAAGAPTLPRLLDVSSTVYGVGGLVDLVVTTTEARLVSMTIEELPEVTIG